MPRDYKKRTSKVKKSGRKNLVIFLLGITVGLGSVAFFWSSFNQDVTDINKPEVTLKTPEKQQAKSPTKPRFEFYERLPQMTLEIESQEPTEGTTVIITKPQAPAAKEALHYVIQVAAFKKIQDAESLKAQLAFLGLQATINPKSGQGTTWHRVQLGPFNDKAKADQVEKTLNDHGFSVLLLKQES